MGGIGEWRGCSDCGAECIRGPIRANRHACTETSEEKDETDFGIEEEPVLGFPPVRGTGNFNVTMTAVDNFDLPGVTAGSDPDMCRHPTKRRWLRHRQLDFHR